MAQMTNSEKEMLERWNADLLVAEVAFAAEMKNECKHEYGRDDERTVQQKEDLEWVMTLLRKKIAELEKAASIGRKAQELVKEILAQEER